MSDYLLYYWQMPFRGQFIRAILAHAGRRWDEVDDDEIERLMKLEPGEQPVPFMGPPVLVDKAADVVLAEMPAIAFYLGETLGLMPEGVAGRAMALKVVNDANDVIDELTLDGGREMWTARRWTAFVPRLKRWMGIWEATGVRHGLRAEGGWLLGGARASIADVVTATLWGTMAGRFPVIGGLLEETAPLTAALVGRVRATPAQANLAASSSELFGEAYCGGRIEESMRRSIR